MWSILLFSAGQRGGIFDDLRKRKGGNDIIDHLIYVLTFPYHDDGNVSDTKDTPGICFSILFPFLLPV
jgi:hypothetical protein